jgi:hypothetical protein
MRLTKIPLPLLIAALVATTAVVIYLNISVVPVPAVVDSNATAVTLVKGTPYLWRGAASEITIVSNASMKVTHMPLFNVIYVSGPLINASLGDGRWMIYLSNGRPLLIERMVTSSGSAYYIVKLVNMTKVNGLSVLVPQAFSLSECLSTNEIQTIKAVTGASTVYRVMNIYTNGTHIMLSVVPVGNTTSGPITHYFKLPPAVNTTSYKITSSGYGVSHRGTNYGATSIYVMPYQHVVIVPESNAKVTITVK